MQHFDVPVATLRITDRQTKAANPPASTPHEYYRRSVYIPLLDCIHVDLRSRFENGILDTVSDLTRFIPARIVQCESSINVDAVFEKYSKCMAETNCFALHGEVDLWKRK